jgi:pimeloyl-ACP methyl ester carboxylesterase
MADDALQVLDEAEVERAYVLGASLGGMIAQELAVKAPARVDKLVLCCTTPGGPDAYPLPEATMKLFVEAPTLILQGTEDNVVDARNAELLAQRIAGARAELIPGTGHLFFWEQPETFLAYVTEFLG